MRERIAIVGGGITGLATAFHLQEQGWPATVFDGAPEFGGLSVAATFPEFTWDRFYHVIAPADQELLTLLDRIGLADSVRWSPTRQGIFLGGALRALSSPLDLLRLPGLSLLDKVRLGLLVVRGRRAKVTPELDSMTSAAWLQQRCGQRAYDRLWRFLLRAKLGDAAERVSARFIQATLTRLASARKTTGGGERFGYVHGGYRVVLDRLVERLRAGGTELRAATPVSSVTFSRERGAVAIQHAGGTEWFQRAIVTLPNPVLAKVVVDLQPADQKRLAATPYLGVLCTIAVGKSQLSPNYILNLCDERMSITGVIESTNVIDPAVETAGRTLVYLPRYVVADTPAFAVDDASVRATALADLARVFPATTSDWLLHSAVHRARYIQPIPIAGAPPIAPPREVVPGRVFVVSNAQLPTTVLNNNDCIGLARAAVDAIVGARAPA